MCHTIKSYLEESGYITPFTRVIQSSHIWKRVDISHHSHVLYNQVISGGKWIYHTIHTCYTIKSYLEESGYITPFTRVIQSSHIWRRVDISHHSHVLYNQVISGGEWIYHTIHTCYTIKSYLEESGYITPFTRVIQSSHIWRRVDISHHSHVLYNQVISGGEWTYHTIHTCYTIKSYLEESGYITPFTRVIQSSHIWRRVDISHHSHVLYNQVISGGEWIYHTIHTCYTIKSYLEESGYITPFTRVIQSSHYQLEFYLICRLELPFNQR